MTEAAESAEPEKPPSNTSQANIQTEHLPEHSSPAGSPEAFQQAVLDSQNQPMRQPIVDGSDASAQHGSTALDLGVAPPSAPVEIGAAMQSEPEAMPEPVQSDPAAVMGQLGTETAELRDDKTASPQPDVEPNSTAQPMSDEMHAPQTAEDPTSSDRPIVKEQHSEESAAADQKPPTQSSKLAETEEREKAVSLTSAANIPAPFSSCTEKAAQNVSRPEASEPASRPTEAGRDTVMTEAEPALPHLDDEAGQLLRLDPAQDQASDLAALQETEIVARQQEDSAAEPAGLALTEAPPIATNTSAGAEPMEVDCSLRTKIASPLETEAVPASDLAEAALNSRQRRKSQSPNGVSQQSGLPSSLQRPGNLPRPEVGAGNLNSGRMNGYHRSPRPVPSGDSDDEIMVFRPSAKRRRTTTTRPHTEAATNRFIADFILESRPVESQMSLQELIASLKEVFAPDGVPPRERVRLLEILASGKLQGQALQYRPMQGKGINLSGRISKQGRISCSCSQCQGDLVSLLEFEEHSGAWHRYQTQCVYLPDHNISLKALWTALNAEFGLSIPENGKPQKAPAKLLTCKICDIPSRGLMRCGGGCKKHVHAKCVGLVDKASGPWSCLDCMENHIQREVAKAEETRNRQILKARAKEAALQKALETPTIADSRRASMKANETPKSGKVRGSQPSKGHTAFRAGKPQRVHMAAPTAKAGLTKGRMVRNSNKHKRLFDPEEPNGVKTGQHVVYKTTQGEVLLEGEIRISRDGPCGILCEHCNTVISASAFEAHAGRGSRRAPYDNIFLNGITLRKLAQALPAEEIVYLPSAESSENAVQEDMMGGCVLCEEKNFQREGFSDLTVILCDGCEREYHIKCLREMKAIDLEGLPEGDWFCSAKCKEIHHALRERVKLGPVDLGDDYTWQLLHGKDGTTNTTWQLKGCQDILEESFDPIIDQISKQNLVKGMVYSEQQGEWDHSGMFAAVLKYKKQNVCALVMRAFGDMLAEVPLIATRLAARRRGHARYLMDALGNLLAQIGVKVLSLPAAHATVETWTKGFGFRPMSADALLETRESLRLLVFPGTEVLYKPLLPEGDPYVAPKKPKQIQAVEGTPPGGSLAPASGQLSPSPSGLQPNSPGLPTAPTILQFSPLPPGAPNEASAATVPARTSPPAGSTPQQGILVSQTMYKPAHAQSLAPQTSPVVAFRPSPTPRSRSHSPKEGGQAAATASPEPAIAGESPRTLDAPQERGESGANPDKGTDATAGQEMASIQPQSVAGKTAEAPEQEQPKSGEPIQAPLENTSLRPQSIGQPSCSAPLSGKEEAADMQDLPLLPNGVAA